MGYRRNSLRIARMVAVALVLAAVGAVAQPHVLPWPFQAGVAQAQSPWEAPKSPP